MGMVDLGTLNWLYDGRHFATINEATPTQGAQSQNAVCSNYAWDNGYSQKNGYFFISSSHYLTIWDSSYTDAASFKTAMSGVQLAYELATPITYSLTPKQLETVKGINHISANGNTTIDVDYCADTKLYIDQKLATAIANALNA
jgi:hypothetical protein